METKRTFLAAVLVIAFVCELASSKVICEDVFFIERGRQGRISCEYDSNLIAVFWYRGDSGNPFLRLEEGRPTRIDGFDITARGDMILESAKIKDEDTYRISVLDTSGVNHNGYTRINVTVSLSTDPDIQTCVTSENPGCSSIADDKKPYTVVCQAKGTRPGVGFAWLTMSVNEVGNIDSHSSMNTTTGLYFSYSIFQYEADSLLLDYITCNATGLAVNDTKNASLFVEGFKEVDQYYNHKTVKQRSALTMKCAPGKIPLQKWTYTDQEGNTKELRIVYPGEESGPCFSNERCSVSKGGILTIADSSFKDEGTYVCTYSNGIESGKNLTNVEVIITPKSAEILIEGCKSQDNCTKDVGFTGNLLASLDGSRPPVEIVCVISKESESYAYIYNHQNDFEEHAETGTFDTIYTVNYDIEKCSPPVRVICRADEATKMSISQAVVYLATDQSSCSSKGKPGLFVFFTILIIFFIVFGSIAYWNREKLRNFLRQRPSAAGGDSNVDVENNPNESTKFISATAKELSTSGTDKSSICNRFCDVIRENKQPTTFEFTNEETKLAPGGDQKTSCKSTSELQNSFPSKEQTKPLGSTKEQTNLAHREKETKPSQSDSEHTKLSLLEDEETSVLESASEITKMPTREDDKTKTFEYVSDHLKSSHHDKETLDAVVDYLVAIMPNKYIRVLDLCNLLGELVKLIELSEYKFLEVTSALLEKKLIFMEKYIEMTGSLLLSLNREKAMVLAHIKGLLSKNVITKMELVEIFLHYFSFYELETKAILSEVEELKDSIYKVPHLYFLQGILKWQQKASHSSEKLCALLSLYNDIVKGHFINQRNGLLIEREEEKQSRQDISRSYLQALLCSFGEKAIDCNTCCDMIVDGLEKQNISTSDFVEVYQECIENDWMNYDEILHIWSLLVSKTQTTETQLVKTLNLLLNRNKISITKFNEILCEIRKNKKISPEIFKKEIVSSIKTEKENGNALIRFVFQKWKQNLISDDEKSHFVILIADTYKIPRDDFKQELERMGMIVDERRAFLRPIQKEHFPG